MKKSRLILGSAGLFLALAALPLSAQTAVAPAKGERLATDAEKQIGVTLTYDPAYVRLAYPNGDVPQDRGVCTDVVIRAFRLQGRDLQKEVHEDMKRNFGSYPKNWGLAAPDPNIDHRRVPNLRVFFTRKGWSLPVSENPSDYKTGDLVTWMLGGKLPHIGIVAAETVPGSNRPLIIHNIGMGAKKDDFLFGAQLNGHYRPR